MRVGFNQQEDKLLTLNRRAKSIVGGSYLHKFPPPNHATLTFGEFNNEVTTTAAFSQNNNYHHHH